MLLRFSIGMIIGVTIVGAYMATHYRYTPTIQTQDIQYADLTPRTQQQIDCLAQNIYHEARGEPVIGQEAVAFVTLNRTHNPNWPSNICAVVKQKMGEVCQFSWWCDNTVKTKQLDKTLYHRARDIAMNVYMNYEKLYDVTNHSVFYHATYVNPNWANVKFEKQIGLHKFYTLKA